MKAHEKLHSTLFKTEESENDTQNVPIEEMYGSTPSSQRDMQFVRRCWTYITGLHPSMLSNPSNVQDWEVEQYWN